LKKNHWRFQRKNVTFGKRGEKLITGWEKDCSRNDGKGGVSVKATQQGFDVAGKKKEINGRGKGVGKGLRRKCTSSGEAPWS